MSSLVACVWCWAFCKDLPSSLSSVPSCLHNSRAYIHPPPSTRVCVCLYVRNQSILFTRTRPVAYEHTSQIKDNGNIGRRGKKEHGGYWRITKCPSSSSSSFWLRDVEAKVWCARADPSMRANHSFRWFFFYLVFFLLQEDVRTTSRQLKYSIGPQWNSR